MYFDEILLFLANNNFDYKYFFVFFFLSIFFLSLPLPYTFIIISNVYVFGWYGFFIVLFSIPLGSILTYFYVKKTYLIIKKISLFEKFFLKKLHINNKFYQNIYLLIFARATLPFFLVSVAMALANLTKKRFLFITTIGTFANVLMVSVLVEGIRDNIIKYNDITINWKDPKFIFPLLFLFLLIFIANLLKKKFKLK